MKFILFTDVYYFRKFLRWRGRAYIFYREVKSLYLHLCSIMVMSGEKLEEKVGGKRFELMSGLRESVVLQILFN